MMTSTLGRSLGPFSTFSTKESAINKQQQTKQCTNSSDDLHALGNLSEDDMTTIKPTSCDGGDELK